MNKFSDMMDAQDEQPGQPKLVMKSAESAHPPVEMNLDVPAYTVSNPRYWEYR